MDVKVHLKDMEADALTLWKVDAPITYKRLIMKELYNLIRLQPNQTDVRLFNDLKRTCYNVTRVEFDCALASLKYFDVIGIHPVPQAEGDVFHVNRKRRSVPLWRKYLKQLGAVAVAS